MDEGQEAGPEVCQGGGLRVDAPGRPGQIDEDAPANFIGTRGVLDRQVHRALGVGFQQRAQVARVEGLPFLQADSQPFEFGAVRLGDFPYAAADEDEPEVDPFIAEITTINRIVPMASPPWTGPIQT